MKKILDYNPKYYGELNRLYSIAHNIKDVDYSDMLNLERHIPNVEKLKAKMLKIKNKHRGYIFFSSHLSPVYKDRINVEDIYIEKDYNTNSNYTILLESINKGLLFKRYKYAQIFFNASKNVPDIISGLNLTVEKKMMEMKIDITAHKRIIKPDDVDFSICKKGVDEAKRVVIQNSIFKDTRGHIDCDIDDIKYEQQQDFFIEDGCIFLCCEGHIAGYSQIILEKFPVIRPFIVNFGIDKRYRGRGLSTPLLNHTLNILKMKGFNEAFLTVDASNKKAYNLYKKAGFKIKSIHNYYLYKYK